MTTSAQALEEIEAMEREAAAAHDPAHMGFSGMISTVVLDRALQIAREGWASSEQYRGEVGGVLESCGATVLSYEAKLQAAEQENERLRAALKIKL